MKAVTAREAKAICKKIGMCFPENDGLTFFAATDTETSIWEFDTKRERDEFVKEANAE